MPKAQTPVPELPQVLRALIYNEKYYVLPQSPKKSKLWVAIFTNNHIICLISYTCNSGYT